MDELPPSVQVCKMSSNFFFYLIAKIFARIFWSCPLDNKTYSICPPLGSLLLGVLHIAGKAVSSLSDLKSTGLFPFMTKTLETRLLLTYLAAGKLFFCIILLFFLCMHVGRVGEEKKCQR